MIEFIKHELLIYISSSFLVFLQKWDECKLRSQYPHIHYNYSYMYLLVLGMKRPIVEAGEGGWSKSWQRRDAKEKRN